MRMASGRLSMAFAILAAAAMPALAETYKWVDARGVVNYSNKPPPAQAAKQVVVEERLSVVAADPSLAPAVRAMNARAARRAEYELADWELRQRLALDAPPNYLDLQADCPYRANCDSAYDLPVYHPYSNRGGGFRSGYFRRAHVSHHGPRVVHGRGGSHPAIGSLR
jgi:uncharacterized protein DUF4124